MFAILCVSLVYCHLSKSIPLPPGTGCQFADFGSLAARGAGCGHGTKLVIKKRWESSLKLLSYSIHWLRKGMKFQFLNIKGKTLYGFANISEKFSECACTEDITAQFECKVCFRIYWNTQYSGYPRKWRVCTRLPWEASSSREQWQGSCWLASTASGWTWTGEVGCTWSSRQRRIHRTALKVRDVGGNCVDGTKFVIKQPKGTRKQFLSIEGKVVIAFVKNGNKFADCEAFKDITEDILCKVVEGAEAMNLTQTC